MTDVLLGLGSNVGDRESNILRAIQLIEELDKTEFVDRSSIYETEPFGKAAQDDFLNTVALCKTGLTAEEIFQSVKKIEIRIGRVKRQHWGPREIDIDILQFGKKRIDNTRLKIPHSGFYKRDFVLIPVYELMDKRPELNNAFEIERINLDSLQKTVICKIK